MERNLIEFVSLLSTLSCVVIVLITDISVVCLNAPDSMLNFLFLKLTCTETTKQMCLRGIVSDHVLLYNVTSSLLVCHLRSHFHEGLRIECPFRGCDRRFSVLSSFASHLSKKHVLNM